MINRMNNEGDSKSPGHETGNGTRQMSITEAAAHFDVSDKTIRRWIKSKRVDARKNGDGKWSVHVGHAQPDTDRTEVQPSDHALVDQLQSENAHLRDQVDRLTQVLAMQTQQNSVLTQQLPAPKQPILDRLKSLFGSPA